jgi:hypothetical protein
MPVMINPREPSIHGKRDMDMDMSSDFPASDFIGI